MDEDDLNRLIKSLERSTKVLKRLLFIRYRYNGDSVQEVAKRIGITKMMGDVLPLMLDSLCDMNQIFR